MSSIVDKQSKVSGRNIIFIILKVLAAAIALGVVGGAVWWFASPPDLPVADQSIILADFTGTHPQSSSASARDQIKTAPLFSVSRFMATMTANWPLAIVSLLVVISVTVAITVAVTVSSLQQHEREIVDDPYVAILEEPEPMPVWFMVVVSVVAMLVSFAAGFATSLAITWFKGRPAGQTVKIPDYPEPVNVVDHANSELAKELNALKNFRLGMKDSEKCRLDTFSGSIALTLVKGDGSSRPIYCPSGFTLNSVWWAARVDAGQDNAGALGNHVVKYTAKGFITTPAPVDSEDTNIAGNLRELVWLHYHPLSNIPGHDGFPPMPPTPSLPSDTEWKEWTDKCANVEACNLSRTAEFNVEVSARRKLVSIFLYSKTTPTVMSVFCAGMAAFPGEKLSVQQVGSLDFVFMDADVKSLWMMREPFKIQSQNHHWVSCRIYE